ncbi:MAG: sulfurtransferase [Gammaproteobacteria bacterium]|jgi:UPF0176 protein|nr:sulfurtransferase [Gammaproteobacteria bacterium]
MQPQNFHILNTSAYKFVALDQLDELRTKLKEKAIACNLKGTILLSPEGVNVFLAGLADDLNAFRAWLEQDGRFLDLPWKDSWSEKAPFNRMLVKLKKEIISMDAPMICQENQRAKSVTPEQLKAWLDAGEEVVMLDTRNDYEYKLGSFQNAIRMDLDHFREFPEKVKELLPTLKHKRVVSFCTGGIRCEKAALYMDKVGFEEVYQLDGGILKYFEDCHGAHYDGDCFVFDKRVAVDKDLNPTSAVMCYACLNPLTPEEQASPLYIYEKQCPYCASVKSQSKRDHSTTNNISSAV